MKNGRLTNLGNCLTLTSDRDLGILRDAQVVWEGETIAWVGRSADLPKKFESYPEINGEGRLLTPGLVDCHTHILFGGSRPEEFFRRLSGESYESIAKAGGGILSTVASTREASDADLIAGAFSRLERFLEFGVTTVEIKSGYGLSLEQELRLLTLAKNLDHPIEIIPTFLGAHTVPKEFRDRREEYVQLVIEKMLPEAKKLSSFCDVFCEEGAFNLQEARQILAAAKKLGMQVKVHADQLTNGGGAKLAAELGAVSADHLEQIDEAGMKAMAKAGTVGVLLPGAVFSLGKRTYPPARKMLDAGMKLALSTDCNPGTSHTENLPFMMTLAALEMGMNIEEIWPAVTFHAAQALGLSDRGQIRPGARADLVLWEAEAPEDLAYHYASVQTHSVLIAGKKVL